MDLLKLLPARIFCKRKKHERAETPALLRKQIENRNREENFKQQLSYLFKEFEALLRAGFRTKKYCR